jgi:hypothetical protein
MPEDVKYQHIDLFLPGWGKFLEKDSMHVRIRYDSCIVNIASKTNIVLLEENGNYRIRLSLDSGRTSYFLSCNKNDEFNDFDDSARICAKDDLPPGKKKEEWLFYSKFLESKLGSAVLKMKYGANERILDFTSNTIR